MEPGITVKKPGKLIFFLKKTWNSLEFEFQNGVATLTELHNVLLSEHTWRISKRFLKLN